MIFLIQSPHGWRGLRQRPHHLASRFAAAGHFVRWLEPRYSMWLLTEPRRFLSAGGRAQSDRIEVLARTLLNGERFAAIRRFNRSRLASALAAPLPSSASGPRVLWLYNPHEGHLARSVAHDLLIYDIMDEYTGFPWSPPSVAAEEAELLERADWVFAGTSALHESKLHGAEGRIECELSGVDSSHFEQSPAHSATPASLPADLEPLKRRYDRLIGYAGTIDLRIDRDLLAAAARSHPKWGWVLLGNVASDLSALENLDNVHLLGAKPYAELPAYYHAWDCAILPFVENELTRHVNPTKMLEYAAARLPIVARALPDVKRHYASGAFLYETSEQFQASLETILVGEQPPVERPAVTEKFSHADLWSSERSWQAIADRMLARLEALLAERASNKSAPEISS